HLRQRCHRAPMAYAPAAESTRRTIVTIVRMNKIVPMAPAIMYGKGRPRVKSRSRAACVCTPKPAARTLWITCQIVTFASLGASVCLCVSAFMVSYNPYRIFEVYIIALDKPSNQHAWPSGTVLTQHLPR